MIERVIIIDDEPASRFLMKIQVKQVLDLNAICFENIHLSEDVFDSKQITLFILDQNLTNGNGNEFLDMHFEKIKQHTIFYFGRKQDINFIENDKLKFIEKSDLLSELQTLLNTDYDEI